VFSYYVGHPVMANVGCVCWSIGGASFRKESYLFYSSPKSSF